MNSIILDKELNWKTRISLRVNTVPHGGHYLAEELTNLGFPIHKIRRSSVETMGSLEDCILLNLSLRMAFNVMAEIGSTEAKTLEEVIKYLNLIPWENFLTAQFPITVTSDSKHEEIRNSMYLNKCVKDAICDRMRKKIGERPDSGSHRDGVVINVSWFDNHIKLWIDTSGKKLTDRGYRKAPHPAPLREGVAAMILYATDWNPSLPLLVPMCGSGTIAIEAALMARNRAPGLLRDHYGYKFLKNYSPNMHQDVRLKLKKSKPLSDNLFIAASDINEDAVRATRQNMTTAGTEHFIELNCSNICDVKPPDKPGVTIIHPEYGARLGNRDKLVDTYINIGKWIKSLGEGWVAWVLSGDSELSRHLNLKSTKKIPFRNGPIDCRLIRYDVRPTNFN